MLNRRLIGIAVAALLLALLTPVGWTSAVPGDGVSAQTADGCPPGPRPTPTIE